MKISDWFIGIFSIILLGSVSMWGTMGKVVGSTECPDVYPMDLDIGYYFASDLAGEITWSKSCPESISASFDPEKDSVIFFHGLQPGNVKLRYRFLFDDHEIDAAVSEYLRLGKNVGVFQWTQLADEPLTNFIRAEGKLDAVDFVASTEYVYLDSAGTQHVADAPRKSVSQIAYEHYQALFPPEPPSSPLLPAPPTPSPSPHIHIIGHSLGAQLVVYLAEKIMRGGRARTPLVNRVTMLDPVFSDSAKPYFQRNPCGKDVATVLGCYMGQLRDAGVAVELYRASFINRCIFSSENNALMVNNSAAVALRLTEWGSVKDGYCWNSDLMAHPSVSRIENLGKQLYNQHRAVIEWYIKSSLGGSPPHLCLKGGGGGGGGKTCARTRTMAVSGLMTDKEILRWAGSNDCSYQFEDGGAKNSDPTDDLFYVNGCDQFNT